MRQFSGDDHLRATKRFLTKADVNRAIAATAGRQHTLVSFEQLKELGLSANRIASRIDAGELYVRGQPSSRSRARTKSGRPYLGPGTVLSPSTARLSLDGQLWRGLLAAPTGSRVGALSSCALLNLISAREAGVHIVHPGGSWDPPRGVIGRRTDHLPETDLARTRGLPHLTVPRSVIDAAEYGSAELIDDLLDEAVTIKVYDELEMRRVISERQAFGGAPKLYEGIARLDATSGEFRSKFERKVMRLVQTSNLIPAPVVNVLVYGFRPDMRFVGTRAIVECDGRDYHRSIAQRLADEERETILYHLGFEILRLRWEAVQYKRDRTLAQIERFVLANQAPPAPRP